MQHQTIYIGAFKTTRNMKKIQIILAQLFLISLVFSCGNDTNHAADGQEVVQDTLVNEEITSDVEEVIPVEYNIDSLEVCIDSIWNCQKVADKNGDWRESSNGELGLSMMQIDREDRIYLDFGENNEFRFVNYWSFIVEPRDSYRISFYDLFADEYIDFGDWCQK